MLPMPEYTQTVALLPNGSRRFVIVDREDTVHIASAWLQSLSDSGRSPNTVKQYGSRIAWYLSWTVLTADWRSVNLSHVVLWRRVLTASPVVRPNGEMSNRSEATVSLWITPLRSFYEWADAAGLLTSDIAVRMTQLKYFAPGTRAGGEYGMSRRVLAPEIRPIGRSENEAPPEWISDRNSRAALEALEHNSRDRFLIDLMYYTGIRAGEALSMFVADLHFADDSREIGCREVGAHFHVRTTNLSENGARSKGGARTLFVEDDLVERYIDYALKRAELVPSEVVSPHVFVNVYTRGDALGKAMKYSTLKRLVTRCGIAIGFPLSGPHMLRHTFATRLVRGIDCEPQPLDVVQGLLGHASIESTRIYTHDLENAMKLALRSVASRTIVLKDANE
jgi:integrase/recombinase XerD